MPDSPEYLSAVRQFLAANPEQIPGAVERVDERTGETRLMLDRRAAIAFARWALAAGATSDPEKLWRNIAAWEAELSSPPGQAARGDGEANP